MFFFKFCSNLLKEFRVNLKAYLDLVCITNTASSSSGKSEAGFWVMFFHGPRLLLCGSYYTALVLYDQRIFSTDACSIRVAEQKAQYK